MEGSATFGSLPVDRTHIGLFDLFDALAAVLRVTCNRASPRARRPGVRGATSRAIVIEYSQEAAALEAMLEGCRIEHVLRPYRPEPSP